MSSSLDPSSLGVSAPIQSPGSLRSLAHGVRLLARQRSTLSARVRGRQVARREISMSRRLGPETAAAGEGGRREWPAMRVISPISRKVASFVGSYPWFFAFNLAMRWLPAAPVGDLLFKLVRSEERNTAWQAATRVLFLVGWSARRSPASSPPSCRTSSPTSSACSRRRARSAAGEWGPPPGALT